MASVYTVNKFSIRNEKYDVGEYHYELTFKTFEAENEIQVNVYDIPTEDTIIIDQINLAYSLTCAGTSIVSFVVDIDNFSEPYDTKQGKFMGIYLETI